MIVASGYEWMTHQPLIRAIMEVYKPGFVLELGVGIYSTPIFKEYNIQYLGVENNKEWADNFKELGVIYHELDADEGLRYEDLTDQQRLGIIYFYSRLKIPDIVPRLLFVDQYASCRVLSINVLRDKFDLIIYHDSESIEINRYDLINKEGFVFYTLKTNGPCTTLMTRSNLDIIEAIRPHVEKFLNDHKDCTLMYVDSGQPI